MTMTPIEKTLVEAAAFEPTRNYERQDYLAALARAVNEMAEDEFDALSTEAQDWFNLAVRALNKKQELPDFPDAKENGADLDEPDEPDEPDEEEPDPSDDEIEPEPEVKAPKAKAPKKAPKAKAKAEAEPEVEAEEEEEKPKKKQKDAAPRKQANPSAGKTDEYGVKVGSQSHAAIKMLEEGCRMSDVTESIGGTYYNLLQKLVKQGHKVEKAANGMLTLIHADKAGKKAKGKK